jgi:hypothetical protein
VSTALGPAVDTPDPGTARTGPKYIRTP